MKNNAHPFYPQVNTIFQTIDMLFASPCAMLLLFEIFLDQFYLRMFLIQVLDWEMHVCNCNIVQMLKNGQTKHYLCFPPNHRKIHYLRFPVILRSRTGGF